MVVQEKVFLKFSQNCFLLTSQKWVLFLQSAFTTFTFDIYISAMYTIFFPDKSEEALVVYRFYESIGMFLCFFVSGLTCIGFRLFSSLGLLGIAIIAYYLCEATQKIRNKRQTKDRSCYELKYDFTETNSEQENIVLFANQQETSLWSALWLPIQVQKKKTFQR